MQHYLTSATLRDCTIELFRDLGFTEILCLAASLVKVCVSLLTAAKSKSILLGSTNYKFKTISQQQISDILLNIQRKISVLSFKMN